MGDINIAELFHENRYPTGWKLLPLFLYFPLGLVLSILRFFISMQALLAASVLPYMSLIRSFVLRTMCLVLGVLVHQEELEKKEKSAKVIVSNHVTPLDHLAVHLVMNCITPSLFDPPNSMNWALGFKDLGVRQGHDVLVQNVKRHLEEAEAPLLAQPEGETTNGTVGLLKFEKWPFSLDQPIQPVVIRVWRHPVVDIAPTVLGSRWWSDLFWFLFVPFTVFTLRYLPVMCRGEGEEEENFARRVQGAVAKDLGISPTSFTCADKAEHLKRVLFRPLAPAQLRQDIASPQVQLMAWQVKDVLPYVPLEVITRDLGRTKSVDLTIANILEGVLPYVPEPQPVSSGHSSSSSINEVSPSNTASTKSSLELAYHNQSGSCVSVSQDPPSFNTSAKTFAKSASDRMLSFQERKARLIENARRKYIEKHELKITGYNC